MMTRHDKILGNKSDTPLRQPSHLGTATGELRLFAVFHLNLAFSSIEERDRGRVIESCYWPLLALAEAQGPIGIEASGYTLEEIQKRDTGWLIALRELIAAGKAEFIGSGYSQLIGPLVPAKIVAANLALGNDLYNEFLGRKPRIALVNEQAYSAGLVPHYLDAGYQAIMMDWDNPSSNNPEWPKELRYAAQRAIGADGRDIALLWTSTVAFQKLQRMAHGDITLEQYVSFIANQRGKSDRALCVYASDAEIFDFRPGRYRSEEPLQSAGEWENLAAALSAVQSLRRTSLMTPSGVLQASDGSHAGRLLRLETAACPVPVKKQRNYNLTRWAVSGRDDLGINAACERIYTALTCKDAQRDEWRTLCYLWASDFRTHITESRWQKYCAELAAEEARQSTSLPSLPKLWQGESVTSRFIDIHTPSLSARLDRRRGLAIQSLAFGMAGPSVGWLSHGHFDDIGVQDDWYTGNCLYEQPGETKITDLEWAETEIAHDHATGDVQLSSTVATPIGAVEKIIHFRGRSPRVDFDIAFHWPSWGKGSLRLGHVTLLPDAFDWSTLCVTTHNGGREPENFALCDQTIDHGAAVSFLVSASCGLGMTEGWLVLADAKHGIRLEIDRRVAPLLCMVTHRRIGASLFCQLALSALELDETRKPSFYRANNSPAIPRRVKFSLIGA